jgi:Mrp family chromosome partitioning ATPase
MKNWKEKFTSQQKGNQAEDTGEAYRAAIEAQPADGAAGASLLDTAAGCRLPQTFEQMRRHLDDIWSNFLLESKGETDLLMFCGSTPGEGCSFLSFHLALFLAAAHNMKTLYVDTAIDVPNHMPCIPGMYGRLGLASFLNGDEPLASLVAATDYANLFVLPSGARQGGPNIQIHKNIISGNILEELVGFCRGNFDIAIFDGQPVASRPITIEFAKRIKNVILVCRYGSSRREVSMVSIEKLKKNGVAVTGVVLNDRQFTVPPSFYSIMK